MTKKLERALYRLAENERVALLLTAYYYACWEAEGRPDNSAAFQALCIVSP